VVTGLVKFLTVLLYDYWFGYMVTGLVIWLPVIGLLVWLYGYWLCFMFTGSVILLLVCLYGH